jgi:hypothetical protein
MMLTEVKEAAAMSLSSVKWWWKEEKQAGICVLLWRQKPKLWNTSFARLVLLFLSHDLVLFILQHRFLLCHCEQKLSNESNKLQIKSWLQWGKINLKSDILSSLFLNGRADILFKIKMRLLRVNSFQVCFFIFFLNLYIFCC